MSKNRPMDDDPTKRENRYIETEPKSVYDRGEVVDLGAYDLSRSPKNKKQRAKEAARLTELEAPEEFGLDLRSDADKSDEEMQKDAKKKALIDYVKKFNAARKGSGVEPI